MGVISFLVTMLVSESTFSSFDGNFHSDSVLTEKLDLNKYADSALLAYSRMVS